MLKNLIESSWVKEGLDWVLALHYPASSLKVAYTSDIYGTAHTGMSNKQTDEETTEKAVTNPWLPLEPN